MTGLEGRTVDIRRGPQQARRAPSAIDHLLKTTRVPLCSRSYRSLAENDSLRFAPAAIDHLLKRTRLPLASSGKRFLSHLVLAALRALTRRKNTPSMAGSCKGGKRIVRQKKHHHSRHALILPFFMFLLPLTAKKNIFIAEPLAESLLFAAAGDRAY